ncbi:MAG: type II toxin-antitoxin system prevent-host-death family antitoxin [Xanthomonadaceae bacterium]|nr:type II toxin-antitoxin system prevent-host-death family antitoxin [Xanthomonadaceae bacterium]
MLDFALVRIKLSPLNQIQSRCSVQTYNIHDAKTQLSRLVEQAAKGESFVIAKAGKPMVKVMALNAPEPSQIKRFGFMAGQIRVPEDFDRMGEAEVVKMFEDGA